MRIIGLTGGIGSGKTTVAKMFMELGVPVYFADDEAKRLMQNNEAVRTKLIQAFGKQVFKNDLLDRALLAQLVFNNAEKLEQLNGIVHPAVESDFREWVGKQPTDLVMQESALIFEKNKQQNYDAVILVTAPPEVKIERLLKRDQSTRAQIRARMNNQLGDAQKTEHATYVIENIDLEDTRKAVEKVYRDLCSHQGT